MDAARVMDLVNNNLGVSITPGLLRDFEESNPNRWACAAYEIQGIAEGFCHGKPFSAFVQGYVDREIAPGGRAVWLSRTDSGTKPKGGYY